LNDIFINEYADLHPDLAYHKIYWDSCPEFEEVRKECLSERQWLRDNYTKKNLVIEDHRGFAVSFKRDTGEPMAMAGVYACGLWNQHTARMLNRLYVFPKFRNTRPNLKSFAAGWIHINHHIIDPLKEVNKYKLYLVTMQDRGKPNHNFFKAMSKSFQMAVPNWTEERDVLIKSCSQDVKKCYQYYLYQNQEDGFYENWTTKPIITKPEWEKLPEGR
jgi:hypothetical protein